MEGFKRGIRGVVASVALTGVVAGSAEAQSAVPITNERSTEIKMKAQESDAVLIKKVLELESRFEALSKERGTDDATSFAIVARSDLDRTLSPFSSPLNDRYVSQDIMIAVSEMPEHPHMIARSSAVEQAQKGEQHLAELGMNAGFGAYHRPAYYFVIEQENSSGISAFTVKMISLGKAQAEILGSVQSEASEDTQANEHYFDETVIPQIREKIEGKIRELGLMTGSR